MTTKEGDTKRHRKLMAAVITGGKSD